MATNTDITLGQIGPYLARAVPQMGQLREITKFSDGQSNPTYLLDAEAGRFVLRAKPPGDLLPSAHQVDREYRVMKALGDTGVAVPAMLHLVDDATSPVGRAFFIMDYVAGRIWFDPSLPGETNATRAAVFDAMNDTLAKLHSVDPAQVGLGDFGRGAGYFARQIARWTKQYRSRPQDDGADMNRIIDWLGAHMPQDDGMASLVHGDYRIDNMIFAPDAPKVAAVLDWELSTLGHPFADLAYQCMQWRLPHGSAMRGLGGLDRRDLGIPSENEYVTAYCARREIARPKDWNFYIVFCFFRLAAILYGVVGRARDGNASNPRVAKTYEPVIPMLTNEAVTIIHGNAC